MIQIRNLNNIIVYATTLMFYLSLYSCVEEKNVAFSESQFYTDSIYSEHLGEFRKHNIYLPAGFDSDKNYSIIYGTDGSETVANSSFKILLDSLINNKIITPTVYVASQSNNKIVDSSAVTGTGRKVYLTYRNFDYVEFQYNKQLNNPELAGRFENHLLYFTKEFIPQVEIDLKIEAENRDRLFYGVSNGAGFGVNLLNKTPQLINTYMCFSSMGSNVEYNDWKADTKYPDLYLQYGNEEGFIVREEAESIARKYKISNSFCDLKVYSGGHDSDKWHEGFINIISDLLKIEL